MNHSKRSKSRGQDRLSELPDSIIFDILWFVPMNDVVRTTILSKRWRNLWTTTPFLNFCISFDDIHKSRCFVNQALFRWNGARILKFKVNSCDESGKFQETEYDKSISSDMVSWVNFAKEKKVELYMVLCNSFDCYGSREKIWWLSQCLYSCSSLKVLSFGVCDFVMNANVLVQWNQLQSLTITEGFGVDEHVVNQILSGSPRLEVLNLSFVDDKGCANLNIRSISLKVLSICKYIYHRNRLCAVSELTICTPNLETLKVEGIPFTKFRLINVSSLTHATIGFSGLVYRTGHECDMDYDKDNGFVSSQDYIGYRFIQILQTIPHVERVTLHYCCRKVLRAMKRRRAHSPFPTIKCLKIRSFADNYEQLVDLLEIFPQLERLVLLDSEEEYCYDDDAEAVKCVAKFPKSLLLQLRTIEVTWMYGESIFSLLEILLKYARKLEKMVLRVDGRKSPESLLLASKKLLKMPRSLNCTIDFLDD